MTELEKTRVAIAAGLLAILLATAPLLESLASTTFEFFLWNLSLKSVFVLIAATLASSLYLTAIGLVFKDPPPLIARISGWLYALSLVLPPALAVGWGSTKAIGVIPWDLLGPVTSELVSSLAAGVMGMATATMALRVSSSLMEIGALREELRLRNQEGSAYAQAKALLASGAFDSAVLQGFESLELLLQKHYSGKGLIVYGRRVESPVNALSRHPEVSANVRELLGDMIRVRDEAAMGSSPISKARAQKFLDDVADVSRLLRDSSDAD